MNGDRTNSEQISSLDIKGLFGRFDHSIRFDPEGDGTHVTIITAPNGYGKTMLLRILHTFFSRRMHSFLEFDFKEVIITFQSKKTVTITKDHTLKTKDDEHGQQGPNVLIRSKGFGDGDGTYDVALNTFSTLSADSRTLRYVARNFPVERISSDSWMDFASESVISTSDVLDKFKSKLPEELVVIRDNLPEWLNHATGSVDTHLIESQQLLSIRPFNDSMRISRARSSSTSVVEDDADDLAKRIGEILAIYASTAQQLDQSFPTRIIEEFSGKHATDSARNIADKSQIRHRLAKLGQKRNELVSVGLIGPTISEPVPTNSILDQGELRNSLSVYIDDTEKKLRVFDDIYERINLFKDIVDDHFLFKQIEFSKGSGILVRDKDTNKEIPLAELSSGEQHELVLIYELLFKVASGSLILIDEPELSLHVAWQKKFISDIQKIQRLKKMTFVIATHSPQIINDKWNLVQVLTHPSAKTLAPQGS